MSELQARLKERQSQNDLEVQNFFNIPDEKWNELSRDEKNNYAQILIDSN